VEAPLLVSAEMNAEHVLLPVREDAVSLFGLPNSEEEHLPHGREGFRSQNIGFNHGTITQAQPR
jgi:hypothetical protein